jgi:hypothetical protein
MLPSLLAHLPSIPVQRDTERYTSYLHLSALVWYTRAVGFYIITSESDQAEEHHPKLKSTPKNATDKEIHVQGHNSEAPTPSASKKKNTFIQPEFFPCPQQPTTCHTVRQINTIHVIPPCS